MIAAIKAYFPRYPTRQAVTLAGAAHRQRAAAATCRSQAVVEIAELLELRAGRGAGHALVLRLLQAGRAARRRRGPGSAARSAARCAAARKLLEHLCHAAGIQPGRNDGRRQADAGVRRVPGRLRVRALHAGRRTTAQESDARNRPTQFVEESVERVTTATRMATDRLAPNVQHATRTCPSSNPSCWRTSTSPTATRCAVYEADGRLSGAAQGAGRDDAGRRHRDGQDAAACAAAAGPGFPTG